MFFAIFWIAFGALFGVMAAQKRGYSQAIGAIVGALLGIFAPLMLFTSGVARDQESKKCPECAEWVKFEAKTCKHCGCRIEPMKIAA